MKRNLIGFTGLASWMPLIALMGCDGTPTSEGNVGGAVSYGGGTTTVQGGGGQTASGGASSLTNPTVGGNTNQTTGPVGGTSNGGATTGGGGGGGVSSATGGYSTLQGGSTNRGGSSTVGGSGVTVGGSGSIGGGASAWKGAVCTSMGTTAIATAFNTGYAAWNKAHVVECGSGLARVIGCQGGNSTCSEGMGYGLLLAVAASDQTTFDKLNAFRKQLQSVNNAPDSSSGKLMAWLSGDTCPPTASSGNSNSATDGDLDAAMALVQADKRWPGGTYLTEAKQYIEAIWLNQVEKDGSGNPLRLKPGNLPLSQDTRDYISYYAPGYFHVFAQLTGQTKWSALADAFYTKLAAQQASCSNGQVPDTFGATDCKIWYDSCRAPWRIANDYGWFGDTRAKSFLDKLRSGSVSTSDPGAGTDQKNSAIVGAFAMSGVSSDNATMQTLCNNWESTQKDDTPYFQKTLRLLYMLVAAGAPEKGVSP